MKKRTSIIILSLFFIFTTIIAIFFVFFYRSTQRLESIVVNVNTGFKYSSIQEAINAPETKDGHTIFIYPGIYRENIEINKALVIKGENKGLTIIEQGDKSEITMLIKAKNVTVSNVKISNCTFGIWVLNTSEVKILNNEISNCKTGIRLDYSSYCRVESNTINGGIVRGVHLYESNFNIIINNEIKNIDGYGAIHLEKFSNDNVVLLNKLVNNSYGITIEMSINNKIYHNSFMNNVHQAFSTDINMWDDGYPSGGNYWSDHNCFDEKSGLDQNEIGKDGICDNEYVIDGENKDRYPLTHPFKQNSDDKLKDFN